MKKIAALIFLSISIALITSSAFAAKKVKVAVASVSAIRIPAKNNVRLNLSNLRSVKNISYMMTYNGNNIAQGVSGTITPGRKVSLSRDLFLGTCSKNVCVKHKNVKNIKITAKVNYVNGTSTSKTYNVK